MVVDGEALTREDVLALLEERYELLCYLKHNGHEKVLSDFIDWRNSQNDKKEDINS